MTTTAPRRALPSTLGGVLAAVLLTVAPGGAAGAVAVGPDAVRPPGVPTRVALDVSARTIEARVTGVGGPAPLTGVLQLVVDGAAVGTTTLAPVPDDAAPASVGTLTTPAALSSEASTFTVRYLGDAVHGSSSAS